MKSDALKSTVETAEANVSDELESTGEIRLDRFSPALITWAAHRLAANNGAIYRKRFGVKLAEWRVLLHIVSDPGSNATQLAQAIGYDKASISRTVEALRCRALIDDRTNEADARSSHLYVTESGKELYRKIVPLALEQERKLLSQLTQDEAEMLVDLMNRIVAGLRDSDKKPRESWPFTRTRASAQR